MTGKITLFLSGLLIFFSCSSPTPKELLEESIIPKPASLEATHSSFLLAKESGIFFQESSKELESVGQYLADLLRPSTGFSLQVKSIDQAPAIGNIYLEVSKDLVELGNEGHILDITEALVTISAYTPEGVFRGIQTLRQLFPPRIEDDDLQEGPWEIATGTISDQPAYNYRGAMLDVARHFFKVEDVKQYIDFLAAFKFNALHLHLSDDQGWRIEIKSWPKLTNLGGSSQVGGGEGGFYTQEEYKELVNYAKKRYMMIIPEIDMPGHTNAALASYPDLNCDGKAREVYTGIDVGFSTLCTSKEVTYTFIDDVVRELSEITPGPYFHIGGDESHVTPLEDYIPFVNRVQEIVTKYNKRVIGWDEIANASLVPNSVVQYWAEAENALKGVEQGAKVLMSPATRTYLDMQYDSTTQWGLHWAAYIEVHDAYKWDPASLVDGIGKEHILGIESPLWTETITKLEEIEYMVFPRIVCHSEVGWTDASNRNWDEFKVRLGNQRNRFEALGINYYPSELVPWN